MLHLSERRSDSRLTIAMDVARPCGIFLTHQLLCPCSLLHQCQTVVIRLEEPTFDLSRDRIG